MKKSRIRIDSVRASRDGHEFHEAWVARKSLGLLLPRDKLVGLAIEGFSPSDQVSKDATEIADAVLYYGRAASFEHSTRLVVVQVKYSKAAELKPFRVSDAKKTIEKFAITYRAHVRKYGVSKARRRLRFEIITNRPIFADLDQAIIGLRDGTKLEGVAKTQANQFRAACKLQGKDLSEFATLLCLTSISGDLRETKHGLAIAMSDWSAPRDLLARLRLNAIRDLARTKAGLASQHRNVISRADVLTALELQHEDELLPCPESFPEVGSVIEREQLGAVVSRVPLLDRPLIIHADGGIGKTVFMRSLAKQLESEHEVILFDCFGMGQYRAAADSRHLPQRGLIHIANLLACRGLCDPILPGPYCDADLIRTFRSRLTQVADTLRSASSNRQLVLMLDAIDNAGEHATARGETSFARLLLEDVGILGSIPGVQLVVSTRSHRRVAATGAAVCDEYELLPFTPTESRKFLSDRVKNLSESKLQVAQSRSRGNARILEHLASEGPELLAPSEIDNVILLDDLLRKKISDALREARRQGYQDTDISTFLAGLATLPPPVPIQELAKANGLAEGAVNSFAADLAPLLEQTKQGLMFRDEPTETLIRESYMADTTTLRELAKNLLGMQDKSVYAATTLPDLLHQLGDGDQLFNLAFDDRIPATITSAAGKQAIRQSRIRSAVTFAAEQNDNNRLVRLLVELSTLAAVNQRGTQYLLDSPDLVVATEDADSLRRLFEARTAWPGSRHARLAIAYVLTGDVADAHRHAQRVTEWRRHYFDQDRQSRTRDEGPTALDMASIPLCLLARGDGEAAAYELAGWRDWFGFEVAQHLFSLVRAAHARGLISSDAVNLMLASKAASTGVLVAALAYADNDQSMRRELISNLAGKCIAADYGEENYRPQERGIIRGMLRAATMAIVLGMSDAAGQIVTATPVAAASMYVFMHDYWTSDVYPFVAMQVLRCLTLGVVVEERHLLPRELSELAAGIPTELRGKDFLTALKQLLQERFQNDASQTDEVRRVNYETKNTAERFLEKRLPSFVRMAQAFSLAIQRVPDGKAASLGPLQAVWGELRAKDDYYSGGEGAQRQYNAVGQRLLTLALSADPTLDNSEVGQYVAALSGLDVAPVENVIEVVEILAVRSRCHVLAGTTAVRVREAIERQDDVTSRASLFARLARAIAPASADEAGEYFRKGLEQMDAIGSGDWQFVSELMHFAGSLQSEPLADSDSHTLSNICDMNLGEEYKFNWAGYGVAMSKAVGSKGISRLARWEDRGRISLNYTLLPYIKALLDNKLVEPEIALVMLRVSAPSELHICGTEHLIETLENQSIGPSASVVTELIRQYQQNNPSGTDSRDALALASMAKRALGDKSAEYIRLHTAGEAIAASSHESNTLNNWRSPTPVPDHAERLAEENALIATALARAAATDPLDEPAVTEGLDALEGLLQGRRLERDFLQGLRAKVSLAGWAQYIELIARQKKLDLYDKFHELASCKEEWSGASSAVGKALHDSVALILNANAGEFVSSGQLSLYQLNRLTELTGVDRLTVISGLLKQYCRPDIDVPAAVWLSLAASFNAKADPGAGQAALSRLLRGGASKLAPLVIDGEWRDGLYPDSDQIDVAAGLIWFGLGSPKADRRWMSAHALRTAVRLGRCDVLNRTIKNFERLDAGPFGASELPFFYLHAQLWLLIAIARIALDAPASIAPHCEFLEREALGVAGPHVLRQHFAREALLACHRSGNVKLTRTTLNALNRVNRSALPTKTSSDYGGASFYESRPTHLPEPADEVHLEYDFDKQEVSKVSELFGRSRWETRDAITAWVRKHDTKIVYMHDVGGRDSDRRQGLGEITDEFHTYGEQLCWHALHAVAGAFLIAHPVTRRSFDQDEPWHAWLQGQALTHNDGLWLSDGTDWRPVETHTTLREIGENGVVLTAEPSKLCAILGISSEVGEWLVIDGEWRSRDGVNIYVHSALVPSIGSVEIADKLSKEEPFHVYLPHLEEYEERDARSLRSHLPYRPWVVQPHADAGIDETDALGVIGAAQRVRLSSQFIELGELTVADPFGRRWTDSTGADALQVEAWCQRADREESVRRTGVRAKCNSAFLSRILTSQKSDLLLLVKLSRTESPVGGRSTQYWHTTMVVRVMPSLEFTIHPGGANELHKNKY